MVNDNDVFDYLLDDFIIDENQKKCFICGTELTKSNRSQEHIFPNWLLTKYNLKKEELVLLDGSKKEYAKMKIPCCQKCNSGYWSNLEETVKSNLERGIEALRGMDQELLYIWLVKLFYGTLVKESSLSIKGDPETKILGKGIYDSISFYQKLMKVKMSGGRIIRNNFSIFIFECYESYYQYDYRDSLLHDIVMIRLGNICILAALNDQSYLSSLECHNGLEGVVMHDYQIYELIGHFAYLLKNSKSLGLDEFHLDDNNKTYSYNWHGFGRRLRGKFDFYENAVARYAVLNTRFKTKPLEEFYVSETEVYSTIFGANFEPFQFAEDEGSALIID